MKRSKIFPILGLVAGALAVIFAIVAFATGSISDPGTGNYTSYQYYGGDAYTGIQQAGADTSQNVRTQTRVIINGLSHLSTALGGLLLALGLGLISLSGYRLLESSARTRYEAAVLEALKKSPAPAEPSIAASVPAEPSPAAAAPVELPVAAEPVAPSYAVLESFKVPAEAPSETASEASEDAQSVEADAGET